VAAKTVAEKESCMRQEEDGDVLDTVIETQKILQKMVSNWQYLIWHPSVEIYFFGWR
jgi:hypothetical protein